MAANSVVGRWPYGHQQIRFGRDDITYQKAAEFLDIEDSLVADWGCGTTYFRRFIRNARYVGIDGSASPWCNVVADLRTYRGYSDGILLRHVLEHNVDWKRILRNALRHAPRVVVVIFTPFRRTTRVIDMTWGVVPTLSFKKADLCAAFTRPFLEEGPLATRTQYGIEHIFYVGRTT